MRMIGLAALAALLSACTEQATNAAEHGASASAVTARGEISGQKRFRDWLAVCDNVQTCHAIGPASEGTGWVQITMAAGPDAIPTVAVGFWPENGDFEGPVTAQIDETVYPARTETGEFAPMAAVVDPGQARALIDAIAQGAVMTLQSGAETVPISLTGAAASLLWIDEQQGRLQMTTALIRKGPRRATLAPPPPDAPVVEPAPAVSQVGYGDQEGQTLPDTIEALPEVARCRAETAFNPALQSVISSARLNARTVLWGVPCGLGAYNFATAYFTSTPDGRNPIRLSFPRAEGAPAQVLINAAYDPATRVIDALNKGRGPGDCGRAESWTWTTQGFVLKSSSEMSECWGVPQSYWPASWVSR